MSDLDIALAIITRHSERAWFAGAPASDLVVKAERVLGGRLPPQYRLFVETLGAGNFGAFEVYGVIDGDFNGPVPDAIWVTLDQRKSGSISGELIVIGDSGDGAWHCLKQDEDRPVLRLWPGQGASPEIIAADFAAYFRHGIEAQS